MWKTNNLYLILFTAALFAGCGEKTEKKEYVARVNDSFLTSDDLEYLSGTSYKNNFYRSEVIRNWIDEELLFQEAVSEGILETEEFNRIINNSRRELAGALLLKYVSDQYEFSYSNDDLEKFYNEYKDEFRLKDDTFILNIAEFTSEEKAIEFRLSVLQNDWQEVIESGKFKEIPGKNNLILRESEIYPLSIRNIIQELYPQEISIVINSDTLSYRIFQVIEKYPKGTIPPMNVIKEVVEKRFVSLEKRKFVNEYIKKLYAENDIEVKNQDNK